MMHAMTSHTQANFRADINGLRAWAVAAVVLYHFGVPGFGGGFVGVDVFFVISGFLMTGLVVRGLERGTFSVLGFYMARGRRIVPALLALCAVLLALGWFVLMPPDFTLLSSHAVYAMSFLSNVEFWQEAGYFDAASHEKWLLHTWSLSVEWQFYLVLPLVLWGVWRLKPGRAAQTWAVAAGLVVSLAASVLVTDASASAAFYLLHARAWEMLGGGLVFLLAPATKLSGRQRGGLEFAGLLLMVLAVAVFDKDTVWPGWRAVLPVAAAMLVLVANRGSVCTGNRVAQWLGDRSYSLYLWHWPVVVALVYVNLGDRAWAVAGGMALTLVLGHVSFAWVENPARRLLTQMRFGTGAAMLAGAVVLVALPAVAVWRVQGVGGRFAPAVELAAAEAGNFNPRRAQCHPNKGLNMPSCVYGGSAWRVIALGDSHAGALVSGMAQAQSRGDAGVVQWSYSGCAFVPGLRKTPAKQAAMGGDSYKCSEFVAWAQAQLATLPRSVPVVIINRYAQAALGPNEDHHGVDTPEVYFSKVFAQTTPEVLAEFAQHITNSACELAKQRTVYLVRPVPEMGFDVPKTLSRRMILGQTDDVFVTTEAYQKRNGWVWAAQDAARAQCGIKILDPTAYLCREGKCFGSQNGRPLYHDDDHLSEFGNKLLVPMFKQVFDEL
jgi:peptidoglycan/LPS O-acetylase OafA/YrhL